MAFEKQGSNMKEAQKRNSVYSLAEHRSEVSANNILNELLSYNLLSIITREDLTVFPSWS